MLAAEGRCQCISVALMIAVGHLNAHAQSDAGELLETLQAMAQQGDDNAQNNLGSMYAQGEGVSQDFSQAVLWFRKAADQGNSAAQVNLGFRYFRGEGVTQDYGQAINLFRN